MKRPIFAAAIVLAALLTGCGKFFSADAVDMNYEYSRSVGIMVRNEAGEDLLDPAVKDNILANKITVEYYGAVHHLVDDCGWLHFSAGPYLTVGPYSEDDARRVLRFGSFRDTYSGEEDRKFTIDWGDGTSDEVRFHYTVSFQEVEEDGKLFNKAYWHYSIWVNGVLASSDSLTAEILK